MTNGNRDAVVQLNESFEWNWLLKGQTIEIVQWCRQNGSESVIVVAIKCGRFGIRRKVMLNVCTRRLLVGLVVKYHCKFAGMFNGLVITV